MCLTMPRGDTILSSWKIQRKTKQRKQEPIFNATKNAQEIKCDSIAVVYTHHKINTIN